MVKGNEKAWDDVIAQIVTQPARYIAIAVGLIVANSIMDLGGDVHDFITRLARSLIIIAIFVALFVAVNALADSRRRLEYLTGVHIEDQLLPFLRTATKLIIMAIALVILIQEWGYNVSGLIAGLGLGGLAFSLAAQDTVANLFGFSTIVGDRPFDVGDFVVTDFVVGIIEKVGLRSTQVRRLDQALVVVPNATMASAVITNWSRLHRRWIELTFGVTYSTSPEKMEVLVQRVEEMLEQRDRTDSTTIQVMFESFGDSALNVLVRVYVNIADWYAWMKEKEQVQLEIMRIVEELGLSMAFPSRSIYLESMPQLPQIEAADEE